MWLKNIMKEYPWGLSHRTAPCLRHNQSLIKTKKCHKQCLLGPQTCLRPILCIFLLFSKRTLHDIIQCLFHNGIFNVWSLLVSLIFSFLLIYFFIDFQTQKSLRKTMESQSETLPLLRSDWTGILSCLPWRSTCLLHGEKTGNEFSVTSGNADYGKHNGCS